MKVGFWLTISRVKVGFWLTISQWHDKISIASQVGITILRNYQYYEIINITKLSIIKDQVYEDAHELERGDQVVLYHKVLYQLEH